MPKPMRRQGLRDEVYTWLRSAITYGELKPGTLLTLQGIADELDVSLTPVREALANLEPTGLVVREARKGYKVAAPLALEELDRVFDARSIIESAAAERTASRVTPEFLGELEACIDEQVRNYRSFTDLTARESADDEIYGTTLRAFIAADTAFHSLILDHCGNPVLAKLAESLSAQWHRSRMTSFYGLTDGADAVAEHRVILDALRAKDSESTRIAMQQHIERIRVHISLS